MRATTRSVAALGGLLSLLLVLLPGVVSAHQITDVQVDCPGKAIVVSGESFVGDGGSGVTFTVSGPEDYLQTFVAEPDVPWTVSLPLGPSGTYTIRWPDPNGGSATFDVDCPDASVPPATPSPTPKASKTPGRDAPPSPHRTLPPTDAMASTSTVARTDTVVASLLFIAVFAAAVAVRRTAEGRHRR
jgi:hypothetical protein